NSARYFLRNASWPNHFLDCRRFGESRRVHGRDVRDAGGSSSESVRTAGSSSFPTLFSFEAELGLHDPLSQVLIPNRGSTQICSTIQRTSTDRTTSASIEKNLPPGRPT